jgi:hypothetical protein
MRLQAIRGDRTGLEHIEALMLQYGFDPAKQPVAQHRPRCFGRSKLRRAIIDVLRQGEATSKEIAARIADTHYMDADDIWRSVTVALNRLKKRGVVLKRDVWRSPVWRLAQ